VAIVTLLAVALLLAQVWNTQRSGPVTPPQQPVEQAYRAFKPSSWWNTPLPDDARTHAHAAGILDYLRTAPQSGAGCLTLAGAGENRWGQPIYWAGAGDPEYDVRGVEPQLQWPPELNSLRIPRSAKPAESNDAAMSIFDLGRGYVTALTGARFDAESKQWSASGATVTYLDSNGLHASLNQSSDRRNTGTHRGNNGATMAVRWDEMEAGAIRHVLKIASGPEVANRFVFPMVGSDGDDVSGDPSVPPQGIRLRIRASVELERLGLHPQALVIARALQRYGMYIGDSGRNTALKLENTVAEGRGQLWDLKSHDLCGLPFLPRYWDVLEEGYDPRR
jgi:hypothetical protein